MLVGFWKGVCVCGGGWVGGGGIPSLKLFQMGPSIINNKINDVTPYNILIRRGTDNVT